MVCFPPFKTLSERKKKWQAERQRRDEELEELRKSSQHELDNLRAQLRKARTSTDNAASEQVRANERLFQQLSNSHGLIICSQSCQYYSVNDKHRNVPVCGTNKGILTLNSPKY